MALDSRTAALDAAGVADQPAWEGADHREPSDLARHHSSAAPGDNRTALAAGGIGRAVDGLARYRANQGRHWRCLPSYPCLAQLMWKSSSAPWWEGRRRPSPAWAPSKARPNLLLVQLSEPGPKPANIRGMARTYRDALSDYPFRREEVDEKICCEWKAFWGVGGYGERGERQVSLYIQEVFSHEIELNRAQCIDLPKRSTAMFSKMPTRLRGSSSLSSHFPRSLESRLLCGTF